MGQFSFNKELTLFALALLYSLYLFCNKKGGSFSRKHFYLGGLNKNVMKIQSTTVEMFEKENRMLFEQNCKKQASRTTKTEPETNFAP